MEGQFKKNDPQIKLIFLSNIFIRFILNQSKF